MPAAGGDGNPFIALRRSRVQARRTIHDAHVPVVILPRVQQSLRTRVGLGSQSVLGCRKTADGRRVDGLLAILDCRDCHHLKGHTEGTNSNGGRRGSDTSIRAARVQD